MYVAAMMNANIDYSFGTLMSITRLLEQFTDQHVIQFKHFLWDQMGVETECQFIKAFLHCMHSASQLHNKTIEKLHNKANEIAYTSKYKILKYNDNLSKLPSSLIQKIGTFLTKKDSIHLSYINRQLYIESQKKSFILKRRTKHDKLTIDATKLQNIFTQQFVGLSYNMPLHLSLKNPISGESSNCNTDIMKFVHNNFKKRQIFNQLFYSLQTLSVYHVSLLRYIPVQFLFNSNSADGCLKSFDIFMDQGVTPHWCVESHQDNIYSNYVKNSLIDNKSLRQFTRSLKQYRGTKRGQQIRRIEKLGLYNITKNNRIAMNREFDRLFSALNGNFSQLTLHDINLRIQTRKQLYDIFHSNLNQLSINDATHLVLSTRNCPGKHGLKVFQNSRKPFFRYGGSPCHCNECNNQNIVLFGCRICNFDLCVTCMTTNNHNNDHDNNSTLKENIHAQSAAVVTHSRKKKPKKKAKKSLNSIIKKRHAMNIKTLNLTITRGAYPFKYMDLHRRGCSVKSLWNLFDTIGVLQSIETLNINCKQHTFCWDTTQHDEFNGAHIGCGFLQSALLNNQLPLLEIIQITMTIREINYICNKLLQLRDVLLNHRHLHQFIIRWYDIQEPLIKIKRKFTGKHKWNKNFGGKKGNRLSSSSSAINKAAIKWKMVNNVSLIDNGWLDTVSNSLTDGDSTNNHDQYSVIEIDTDLSHESMKGIAFYLTQFINNIINKTRTKTPKDKHKQNLSEKQQSNAVTIFNIVGQMDKQ